MRRLSDSYAGKAGAAARRPGLRPRALRRTTIVAAALLILSTVVASAALAWYTATSAPISGRITAGTWAKPLIVIAPGCAKAVHYDPKHCPKGRLLRVATVGADGRVNLDFGDVTRCLRVAFPDSFRITSKSDKQLQFVFSASGAIAPFVERIGFVCPSDPVVLPGRTRSVLVSFRIPSNAARGVYTGVIVVTIVGTGQRYELPAVITVISVTKSKMAPERPHPDTPMSTPSAPTTSPSPGAPSQSATPPQSATPSQSATPPPATSGSPAPSPSAAPPPPPASP